MENFKLAKLNDRGGDLTQQWYIFYSFRHPETKEFVRFKKAISLKLLTKTARHQKAAEMIKDLNFKLRNGWNPIENSNLAYTTICEAMDKVISVKRNILRIRTLHTYEHLVRLFKHWLELRHYDKMYISSFTFIHAQQFMDWTKTEKKVQNRTYNNYITHMRVFFNFLIERDYIELNPFRKCKKLPKDDPEIVTFTRGELNTMREHLPQDNFNLWACAQLIFFCFIRPAEIMRLRPKDIDLDRQLINVHGYLSKNRKDAVVYIPDPLLDTLTRMNIEYIPEDHYIFARHLHHGKKQAAPTRIAEAWRKWADANGIKKNIYHLKHTGAGMALEAGMNVRDLQLQLRHSSLEMTQVYLDRFRRDPGEQIKRHFPTL